MPPSTVHGPRAPVSKSPLSSGEAAHLVDVGIVAKVVVAFVVVLSVDT